MLSLLLVAILAADAGKPVAPEASPQPTRLDGRTGSPALEQIRINYIVEACTAPTRTHVARGPDGKSYEIVCTDVAADVRDPENGFLPAQMNGYQTARWGMTRAEVRKARKGLRDAEGLLVTTDPVAGFKAVTAYHFTNERLDSVVIIMDKAVDKGKVLPERYEALLVALTSKYGAPAEWEEPNRQIAHWNNDAMTLRMVRQQVPAEIAIIYSANDTGEVEKVSTDGL